MSTITEGSYREKKDLNPDEFNKAKATCEFVIELTKAISRSGYYDASHPVSLDVKKGLHTSFIDALGNSTEIMLTCHDFGEKVDIFISGILDEPFNIRKLTKESTLDLFVPKLKDYFERKSLNSFVIKKNITPEHFESFIDVMSEPVPETNDTSSLGDFLTKALIDLNITEVSTVFKTDIVLRAKLPWRVAIILRRLAKDLKVLPMYKDASEDKLKQIRMQIVADIIRPLNNNDLLRDLLINCDIIASFLVESTKSGELEEIIFGSLQENELLPVTQSIFDVYLESKKKAQEDKSDLKVQEKYFYLSNLLNIAARQIIAKDLPDTAALFKQLFDQQIITIEMLPAEIRFNIQSIKMAGDVVAKIDSYIEKALKTSSPEEMESLINIFDRIMPELIRLDEWDAIGQIVKALCGFTSREGISPEAAAKFSNLPDAVFAGSEEIFAHKYVNAEQNARNQINEILTQLSSVFIKIAGFVLDKSKDPAVLKNIIDIMSKKGEPARQWCIKIFSDLNPSPAMLNYALLVIVNAGQSDDSGVLKKYVKYPNPSIRSKTLGVIAKLNKTDAQELAMEALSDEEEKVRSQAVTVIERELSLSEESVKKLMTMVKEKLEKKKEMTMNEAGFIAGLIKATGRAANGINKGHLENEIIAIASDLNKGKNGFLKIIKTEPGKEQSEIIAACMSALGKIGGAKSKDYLKTMLKGEGIIAKTAQEAMEALNKRVS